LLEAGNTIFGKSAGAKDLAQTGVGILLDPSMGLNPLVKQGGLSGQGVPSIAPDVVDASVKGAESLAGASAEATEEAATGVGLVELGIDAVLTVGSAGYCWMTQ
jgi:hypothetical protein